MILRLKNKIESLLAVTASLLISALFLTDSPLHPWRIHSYCGTDSSVFLTVALMMEKGYMPYRDSFDHKGPLIYIIDWLGNRITYYRGVWIMELLFLTVTVFFICRISRLSCGRVSSTIVTLASLSLLADYFEGGNLTEEYAMPFIAIALYIFLDYSINNRVSRLKIGIEGLCLGAVLLLRPNMISVWIVFCLYISVKLLIKRDFIMLLNYVIFFIAGLMIILLPILIWLRISNSLVYFWDDYIIFNKMYSSATFSEIWSAFIEFVDTRIFIISFSVIIIQIAQSKKPLNAVYAVYMIMTVIFMVISGRTYGHYGMIIIPLLSYPLSLIFMNIEKLNESEIRRIIMLTVSVLFVLMALPFIFDHIRSVSGYYEDMTADYEEQDEVKKTIRSVVDVIQKETAENEAISVYGSFDVIYVLSKRKHATKYSYLSPISEVRTEIMDEYFSQLQEELPSVVVLTGEYQSDNRMPDFLESNGYHPLWPSNDRNSALVFGR